MMKHLFCLIAFLIGTSALVQPSFTQSFSDKTLSLRTVSYRLDFSFDFKKKSLDGKCVLQVRNIGDSETREIPLILYRLLKVESVTDPEGNPIAFKQQVFSFEDWPVYQANHIRVLLDRPLLNEEKRTIIIEYSGYLLGYAETGMQYVRDKIDPEFTILRPDSLAYPALGYPSFKVNRAKGLESFDYEVSVTVPEKLTVANGGQLVGKSSKNGLRTFIYRNSKPAWRIDIAIAEYGIRADERFSVYYFPADAQGALRIYKSAKQAFNLYSKWWGPLKNADRFSVIEIPGGWGSQADVTSILQTADAFRNDAEMGQLYHEISHIWNVPPRETEAPRWNEGLAVFIQHLTVEKLEGRKVMDDATIQTMNSLKIKLKESEKLSTIPMNKYGEHSMTGYSYSVGMLMFRVLYELVGEDEFNRIIASFYQKYYESGASTEEFIRLAKNVSGKDLSKFFDDWMYTTNFVRFIRKDTTFKDIVKEYK